MTVGQLEKGEGNLSRECGTALCKMTKADSKDRLVMGNKPTQGCRGSVHKPRPPGCLCNGNTLMASSAESRMSDENPIRYHSLETMMQPAWRLVTIILAVGRLEQEDII